MKASEIKKLRGSPWTTSWSSDELVEVFDECGPYDGFYHMSTFNLCWFVEQILMKNGKPLQLLPFQQVVLDILWNKKFPMLIMTRGGSKCITGDSIIFSNRGMLEIGSLGSNPTIEHSEEINLSVASTQCQELASHWYCNGKRKTRKIITNCGYSIEGTENHPIIVLDSNGTITFKHLIDIQTGDYVAIQRNQNCFGNTIDLPEFQYRHRTNAKKYKIPTVLTEELARLLGYLIGDSNVTTPNTVGFTNIDSELNADYLFILNHLFGPVHTWKDTTGQTTLFTSVQIRKQLLQLGIEHVTAHFKTVPSIIMSAPKYLVAQFLKALFDSDGTVNDHGVGYTTASRKLAYQLQIILLNFGIVSILKRRIDKKGFISYKLQINGPNASLYLEQIGFNCLHKKVSLETLLLDRNFNTNIDIIPFQKDRINILRQTLSTANKQRFYNSAHYNNISYNKLQELLDIINPEIKNTQVYQELSELHDQHLFWDVVKTTESSENYVYDLVVPNNHTFVANGFINHNTFMLAVYAILRALLNQGSKVVVMGAGFRQAKHVFRYIEELVDASPILQEAISHDGGVKWGSDTVSIRIGASTIRGLPIGDGTKIRGERATHLLADEFASIAESIFDHAVAPFTSVGLDPAAKANMMSLVDRLCKLGAPAELLGAIELSFGFGNQIVYSGSACHVGNHFGKRYNIAKMIIQSRGDKDKIRRALEEKSQLATGKTSDIVPEDIESLQKIWHQYAIVQLPYTALPKGFMEDDIIRAEKANLPHYRFQEEYMAQFTSDTNGFIRRSWIEQATPKLPNVPVIPELYGDPKCVYVMGVDPARNNDNLGIIVLKLTPRGKEVVYCNAWDKTEFGVSARRIREIVKRFNVSYIAMDKGGGGESIREWLCKKYEDVNPADFLWVIPEQMEKLTGSLTNMSAPGRKIIEMVDFSANWISQAAHSVEADIEHCNILFPHTGDDVSAYNQYIMHFGLEKISDSEKIKLQEDLWGVDIWEAEQQGRKASMGLMQHITECTNEACAIVRTVTPGGVEHFDLPKLSEQSEGLDMRRRDRWSALMLANYAAKVFMGTGHRPHLPAGMAANHPRRGYTNRGIRGRGSVRY